MTDKELIRQEIERRRKQLPKETEHKGLMAVYGGIAYELTELLQFIDSLSEESGCEVNFTTKSEDLKEEIERWIKKKHFIFTEIDEIIETASHFAEWQKQNIKEALQTEYEKGRFDMQQEMMKDAVECIVEDWCGDSPEITIPLNPQDFKAGNKVKIIICKTEQQ